ncbi:MAG TPA: YfhO family protein [Bryobacteraceae bacterium]|nr:YfhO family protein [Bryobacteraceae bacterium]
MRLRVALLSFLATYLFFYEYLPPWKTIHLFGDIEGYHYPLYTYAQRALHERRLPEWDAGVYSGISFVGNPQAALFYPPNWIVYFVNRHRTGVRYWTIEAMELFHYWIAFLIAWLWLREEMRTQTAALLGAAIFTFAGYRVSEIQHLGAICAHTWYPLGLWGVSQAVRQKRWRPLWKTAAASALCLLAGYPPTWFVLCVCCVVYALALDGWRMAMRSTAALAFSLLLAMVQLAPILEAALMKFKEQMYGGVGLAGGAFFYLQFLLPNYYDQSRGAARFAPPPETYLYLGAPALIGIGWLIARRQWRPVWPALAILGVSLLVILNPGYLLSSVMLSLPVIAEACRDWNFLAAVSLSGVMLAAAGVDGIVSQPPHRFVWPCVAAAAAWSVRLWMVWKSGGHFATGWWTVAEAAVTASILYALLRAPKRGIVVAATLFTVWMELKVYGTSRRFNAADGNVDKQLAADVRTGGADFVGIDRSVYAQLLRDVDYRIVSDEGPHGTELRFAGLSTPAGFDPFLPAQYRAAVERYTPFETPREFRFLWNNPQMMDDFAVRYVLTAERTAAREKLLAHPRFRLMEPATGFYSVFEYLAPRPAYRFDAGMARRITWTAGQRVFEVRSDRGGGFHHLEQYFPGWRAYVDGGRVSIERVRTTFQGIQVPPGRHVVEFRYQSMALRAGAVVSAMSVFALLAWLGMKGFCRCRR